MTTRPKSARVSSVKNGRKTSLTKGAVFTLSQPNSFNRKQIIYAVPDITRVGDNIFSYDGDDFSLTSSQINTGDVIESLPVEVMRIYNSDGSIASLATYFTHRGVEYEYYPDTFTINSPNRLSIPNSVAENISGKYLVHNHPNGVSFSFDDFNFARQARLAGIEAVPKRKEFWSSVKELNRNQQQLLYDLENIRREYYRRGFTFDANAIERAMQFVAQVKPNSNEPIVRFQASPPINKGWSSQVSNSNLHLSAFANITNSLMGLRYLSTNARDLIASHGINEVFAEKTGFRYAVVGIE